MARFFSADEIDPGIIKSSTVAILGYGNQGHAHALNLQDSGVNVVIGARAGKGADLARRAELQVLEIGEAVRTADVVMVSLPDVPMRSIYQAEIAPNLREG